MKIKVEYMRYFEELGFDDFDTVEFNNITSTDKRIWVGNDRIM